MLVKKITLSRFMFILFCLVLLGATIMLTRYISGESVIKTLTVNSQQHLTQFIGHLDAQLNRFQDIPQLIAKNQLLIQLLNNAQNAEQQLKVNQFLAEVNQVIGASDTYLMDINGLTLAASNWQQKRPFVGRNFSFRPYFIDALKGGLGRYFALGTTSGTRGYYFSYPVLSAGNIMGVIVVKMDLSNIEQHWAQRNNKFMVLDRYGVVLITTQKDWLFKSLNPLTQDTRRILLNSKQYGQEHIEALDYKVLETMSESQQTLQLGHDNKNQYLVIQQEMPNTQWMVKVFTPLKSVTAAKRNAMVVLLLVISLLFLMYYLAQQKKKRRQEKVRDQLKAQQQLKHEVSVRTADLSREIEQHKQTEQLLKATQKELIQTAKLAVLGEMSASISHELNNPLAAIRSYADNARQLLALNKTQQVDDNLERVSALTERMGKISSQLKLFARQSSGSLSLVNIKNVIQSAIDISSPQFKDCFISINTDAVKPELSAKANNIQLEQVLINLLNNAMFAVCDAQDGVITLSCEAKEKHIVIKIEDNGPGIEEESLAKIFDPFYTTKKSGMGLGLSISARIIDGFGGQLTVHNVKPHGACFCMTLLKN